MSTTSPATTTSPDARPTRRTVTRAAAWTVPVVAVSAAAPAYAASCSALTGASFATWSGRISNGGLDYSQTYTPPAGTLASSIEMKIAASYTGFIKAGSETSNGPSLYDVYNPVGNTGKPGLGLIQAVTRRMDRAAPGRSARGAYTFSFTKPVRNLVLNFTDIDRTAGDFLDRVELSGPWVEVSRGSGVWAQARRPPRGRAVPPTATAPAARATSRSGSPAR